MLISVWRKIAVVAVAGCLSFGALDPAVGAKRPAAEAKASANKGRIGKYEVPVVGDPTHPCYTVYAPQSYRDENPAGLYLFIHGMNGGDKWAKTVPGRTICDEFNLIGIAPSFTNAGFGKQTPALRKAMAQVMADYRIIVGRGIMACYSAGGGPGGALWRDAKGRRGPNYPFHCTLVNSAVWGGNVKGGSPEMVWVFSAGEKEFGSYGMYKLAGKRFAAGRIAPETSFRLGKGLAHQWPQGAMDSARAALQRADLACNGFLWEDAYSNAKLKTIAQTANGRKLGQAARSLETFQKTLTDKGDEKTQTAAKALQTKLDARVEKLFETTKQLAANDLLLCDYYGKRYSPQLKGHPREKEYQTLLATLDKTKLAAARKAYTRFAKAFPHLFAKSPTLAPNSAGFLESIIQDSGKNSHLGVLATEYLQFK